MNFNFLFKAFCLVCLFYWSDGSPRLQCSTSGTNFWPPLRINSMQSLTWLRNEMARFVTSQGPTINAYILTADDEHQSEYPAGVDRRLEYVSGFSGRTGFAVITSTSAALWTTEKFYPLADQQLDCNWELMKIGEPGVPTLTEWLKRVLKTSTYRVGADSTLISSTLWEEWSRELEQEKLVLTDVQKNLVDFTWGASKRPSLNADRAFVLPPQYAGETWQNKVMQLRQNLTRFGCDAMVVTALEEIAWLLNIRGRDLPYNPFVKAFLIVDQSKLNLFVPSHKIGNDVRRQLKIDYQGLYSVRLHPYDSVYTELRTMSQAWDKVLLPTTWVYSPGASQAIVSSVPPPKRVLRPSPIIQLKAKKNLIEASGMRNASLRDSAAFVDFIAFLEEEMSRGENLTELDVVKILESYKHNQNLSQGPGAPTVAAYAHHGASFYYENRNATNRRLGNHSTLVLQSVGHYMDGTSFIARTLHFEMPTREMVEAYTTLLSAHIALSNALFPTTIKTGDLDTVMGSKLWKAGINYKLDLGHGLGFFSNIYESPIMINSDSKQSKHPLKEGYFFTSEPTYVRPHRYGVKLGNVLEVISAGSKFIDKQTKFYKFRDVTLVPFERRLIDASMLTKEEVDWLNDYHLRVMQEVGAELKRQSKMKGFYYLMEKTKEIPVDCSRGGFTATAPHHLVLLIPLFFFKLIN